jgi:hypothetical protein
MTSKYRSTNPDKAIFGEFAIKLLTYEQCMAAIGYHPSLASFEALVATIILEFGSPLPTGGRFTFVQLQELYRNWQTLVEQNQTQLKNLF